MAKTKHRSNIGDDAGRHRVYSLNDTVKTVS